MNHVLKQTITCNWKSRPLTELVYLVQDIVVGQYEKLRSALVVATGEFEMAASHKQFQTSTTERNDNKAISTNGTENTLHATQVLWQLTVAAPKTNGRKPGPHRKRKINIKTSTLSKKTKGIS